MFDTDDLQSRKVPCDGWAALCQSKDACALLVALSCNDGSDSSELPEVIASSRYVDLRVATDASAVCMDDPLAEIDRFIDETAAFIGAPPPAGRIDFVLVPEDEHDPSTWPCRTATSNCYRRHSDGPGGTIYSGPVEPADGREFASSQWHELVHAVDVPANGRGHWLLVEGLATYLGDSGSTDDTSEQFSESLFAGAFEAEDGGDYAVAMHFAGSLIESHGIEAFMDLRGAVPAGATYDEFAAIFQDVYDEPLSDALAWMHGRAVTGRSNDTAWSSPRSCPRRRWWTNRGWSTRSSRSRSPWAAHPRRW